MSQHRMSQRRRHTCHQDAGGFMWSGDHMDRNAKGTGGQDLAVGGTAAAVLTEDRGDAMLGQQVAFVRFGEGAASQEIGDVRQIQGRVDGIDRSHDIAMLRSKAQRADFLAPEGDKDGLRIAAQRPNRCLGIGRLYPQITARFFPAGTMQGQQQNTGFFRGRDCVTRNLVSIGVGGVDQMTDALVPEVSCKPVSATKAASSDRHGLTRRIGGTARQRQDHRQMGKATRQLARFGRAAQNQDFCHG